MNYVEVKPEEHEGIVKRIKWIQEKEKNKEKRYRDLRCEAYERSLIPWTQKIVQIFKGTYRPMEIPDDIEDIKLDYVNANPRFANDILKDIEGAHDKSVWIPAESYRKIMNNSNDGEKYEWSHAKLRYDTFMEPINILTGRGGAK